MNTHLPSASLRLYERKSACHHAIFLSRYGFWGFGGEEVVRYNRGVEGARAFFIANQTAVTYGMSAPLDKALATIGNGFLVWIMDTKICTKCKTAKGLAEFAVSNLSKDGRAWTCKECAKERQRIHRQSAEVKAREKNQKHLYYLRNKESILEKVKAFFKANPGVNVARNKAWREANPDYATRYRETTKRRADRWKNNNPDKFQVRFKNRLARERNATGTITAKEWRELKKRYDNTCLCCKRKEPEITLTLDHVVPLVKGGTNTIENAQPLCNICNCRKGTKDTDYR